MRSKFNVIGAMGFFLCVCLPSLQRYANAQVNIASPQEGQRWEFRAATKESVSSSTTELNGEYEIIYNKNQLNVYQISGGQRLEIAIEPAAELRRMIAFGQDERKYLKFPFTIGEKWVVNYLHTSSPGQRPRRRMMEYEVKGTEQANIAGKALLVYKIEGKGGTVVPQERVFYYSPDLKCIVKFHYDSAVGQRGAKVDIELTKYSSSVQ